MKTGTKLERWSAEDDLYLQGCAGVKSAEEIARELNRSYTAVQQRASRMNISLAVGGRQWVPLMMSEVKKAVELIKKNRNKSACALSMGVTHGRFSSLLKRAKKMGLYVEKANIKKVSRVDNKPD